MPILDPSTLEFVSRSPEQTRRLGLRIGAILQKGDVICLCGELGSGKTTFVQGIAQGWGSLDDVSSPTFVLVNQYRRPSGDIIFHLDAYRLLNCIDAEELDITMMIEEGSLIIEWAERIENALPREHLWVTLTWLADEQRAMVFQPRGVRYEKLIAAFRQKAFGG